MNRPKIVYIASMARPTPQPKVWECTSAAMTAATSLRRLRIGCSFVPSSDPRAWFTVIEDPRSSTVLELELSLGLEDARGEHNQRALISVLKSGRVEVIRRAGFADLFVPVARGRQVFGVLVCGPILDHEPTQPSLMAAFREVSGTSPDQEAPSFLSFVRTTLDSHVFAGSSFGALVEQLLHLGQVMAGAARPHRKDMKAWLTLQRDAPEIMMWELASQLVDTQANQRWIAAYRANDRAQHGIERMPNYAIGLVPSWEGGPANPTCEVMLKNHQLQRASASVAAEIENTVAGRIGAEGAFFLTYIEPGRHPTRRLRALAERLTQRLGRALDTKIACGLSARAAHGGELPTRYQEALRAVLWGLHTGKAFTLANEAGSARETRGSLFASSRLLHDSIANKRRQQAAVAAERVVRDVLWAASGNQEAARSHFTQMLWELLGLSERREMLDHDTVAELEERFRLRMEATRTTAQAITAFTDLVSELASAVERPSEVGRRARLERARRIVEIALLERDESTSALGLNSVAKQLGMSRSLFAKSFREAYGTPFGAFVTHSRVERSKRLLETTNLKPIEVGRDAGWSSRSYFSQVFKRLTGVTPAAYRRRVAAKVLPDAGVGSG